MDETGCCVELTAAEQYFLEVVTNYTNAHPEFTARGIGALKLHEARRRLVYRKAFLFYIDPHLNELVGLLHCCDSESDARSSLEKYLTDIRDSYIGEFISYVDSENAGIEIEITEINFNYRNGKIDGLKQIYGILDPALLLKPPVLECP